MGKKGIFFMSGRLILVMHDKRWCLCGVGTGAGEATVSVYICGRIELSPLLLS